MTTTDTAAAAIEAAYQLLGFIFDADDLIEFRTLGKVVGSTWAKQRDAAQAIAKLATLGHGVQVYFGANPRRRRGGKAEDVAVARCLFADFDGGTTVEQARLRWSEACIPEPTVIVITGGGVHAWWRLQEPMEDLALWTQHQKALARRLGSDQSVTDAPRIMRLPGFVNWKYQHQPLCVVESCDPDNAYSVEEFPDPTQFVEPAAAPVEPEPIAAGTLSDLSRRFLDSGYLIPGRGRRDTIYTVACDMRAREWRQGDAEAAILSRARSLGLTADDLLDLPRQIGNAFAKERTPILGRAEDAQPVVEQIKPIGIRELLGKHTELRRPIIHKVLRSGETMNIIAAPKTGKSWMVLDLAMCVATGRPWFNRFQVEKAPVLLIDNELHDETLAGRIKTVADAKGIKIDALDGMMEVRSLRGELQSFAQLEQSLFKDMKPGQYAMIIFDAFYRFNTEDGADENDNGYMASVYNRLDKLAKSLDCCLVCIHHTSKGNQSDKAVTDVGAGAGSMSRAADTHLVLREHELAGHLVIDAATRSWPPLEGTVVRFEYPLFHPEPLADPRAYKKARKGSEDGWTPERFAEEIVGKTAVDGKTVLARSLKAGLTESRCKTLRMAAEGDGLIENIGGKTKTALWVCRVQITHSGSHSGSLSESSPNRVCKADDSVGETLKGSPHRINQQPVGATE